MSIKLPTWPRDAAEAVIAEIEKVPAFARVWGEMTEIRSEALMRLIATAIKQAAPIPVGCLPDSLHMRDVAHPKATSPDEAWLYASAWNACRDAVLCGAQPGQSKGVDMASPFLHDIKRMGGFLNADRADNDHFTADPIFTVQKKVYVTGIDTDFTEQIGWFNDEGDSSRGPVDAGLAASLEDKYDRDENTEGYTRTGYAIEWRYVASYFTKTAAEAFIAGKRHEGEMRVCVDSAYRNHEGRAVQQFLMAITA